MNTPRTDSKTANAIGFYTCATVPASLARDLEAENIVLRKALQGLIDCPDYRTIKTHEMKRAEEALATTGPNWTSKT